MNQPKKIIRAPMDVDARLQEFGISRTELKQVIQAVVGAKNSSVATDPLSAPGQLSYIFGTRTLRQLLMSKGYIIRHQDNIEEAYNPETGFRLIFQNVDSAADPMKNPKAISKKGPASERMLALATPYLFPDMEEERQARLNSTVWYFCVSVNDDDVRAELSRPLSIENGQFGPFVERIFVVGIGEWNAFDPSKFDEDLEDQPYEISVTRK